MPLGVPPSSATLHATLQGGTGAGGLRVGVNGQTGDAGATQYGLAVGRDRGQGGRFDASLARRLPAADVVATLDRAPGSRSASLAASGGLVFHRGGVTPAPRLGGALALVQAPGARGAAVAGAAGVRIGRRGYVVVPYLTPYRWNAIDLDPTGTSLDVGFVSTHRRVAPTAGAVVLVPFETALARTVLVTGRLADGRPLPFGAEVFDGQARSAGVVGQAGRIFLRADRTDAHWTVRWAGAADGQCALRLQPAPASTARTPRLTGVCE
jgi:outer membrane usher protein